MKIKIVKNKENLDERAMIHSKMSTKYILNNILDPSKQGSIFDKKLIFYDLETNGFGEKAYVHQIAALEFDVKSILTDYLSGKPMSGIANLTATGGFVSKAKFNSKDFAEQDEIIKKKRKRTWSAFKGRGPEYEGNKEKNDEVSHEVFRKLFRGKNEADPNMELDPKTGNTDAIIGALLAINETTRINNSQLLTNLLLIHMNKKNPTEFDVVTQLLLDSCGEWKTTKGGEKLYEIFKPEQMFDINDSEGSKEFFMNLCDLFRTFSSSPYHYTKSKGPKNFRISEGFKKFSKITYYLNKVFAFTYTENKNFTQYENFPLEKYESFHPTGFQPGSITEEQGLRAFLQYLKSLGKDNYILVGHNIKSFDNNVIMKRTAKYRISKKLVDSFQDSQFLDSLDLLTMYTKQMQFFADLLPIDPEGLEKSTTQVATRSKESIETIVLMHKKLKSKLDGLMKIFEETKNFTQTHTADDDCEKLAQVLIRAIGDMYEMDKAFTDLDNKITFEPTQTRPFTPLSSKEMTPGKIRSAVLSKFTADLAQANLPSVEKAKYISTLDDPDEAVEKTISNFGLKTIQKFRLQNRQNSVGGTRMTDEELLSYFLQLKTKDVIELYNKWEESQMPSLFSFDDLQDLNTEEEPDEDPAKFNEGLIKRWTRAIK